MNMKETFDTMEATLREAGCIVTREAEDELSVRWEKDNFPYSRIKFCAAVDIPDYIIVYGRDDKAQSALAQKHGWYVIRRANGEAQLRVK